MNLAIFDIDGTLTDSHAYDVHFFAALAEELGVASVENTLEGWTHTTDEAIAHDVFRAHGRTPMPVDVERVKARYAQALRENMVRVPRMAGARTMLDSLREHGAWRLAIASGNWTMAARKKLDAGGIETDGVPVVGCDERPARTEIMEHALRLSREAHGEFARVVYVGDARWDVEASRELGWNFVGIAADRARLLELGATHVLSDYRDLEATHAALLGAGVPR